MKISRWRPGYRRAIAAAGRRRDLRAGAGRRVQRGGRLHAGRETHGRSPEESFRCHDCCCALHCRWALGLRRRRARSRRKPVEPLGQFQAGPRRSSWPQRRQGPRHRADATTMNGSPGSMRRSSRRFRRYDGDQFYHLGVRVEGYVLAAPGIPLVVRAQIGVIVTVTVCGRRRGHEAERRSPSRSPCSKRCRARRSSASGLTQTKEEQLTAAVAERRPEIENWLREHADREGLVRRPRRGRAGGAPRARRAPGKARAGPLRPPQQTRRNRRSTTRRCPSHRSWNVAGSSPRLSDGTASDTASRA